MFLALYSLLSRSTPAPPVIPISPNWLVVAPRRRFLVKAPPRVFSIAAPKRRLLLSAHTAPFIGDFSPISPNERPLLQMNFTPQLAATDTLQGASNWGLSVYVGLDPNAANLLSTYAVSFTGKPNVIGVAMASGAIPGVVYRLFIQAVTKTGAIIRLYAHVPCEADS